MESKVFAIYSRKSKLSETGDSVENQIKLCQDYIAHNFPGEHDIEIYEDEGFSGGNKDRPMFQKLLRDIDNKKINVLVCYRLDRISRNVVDFSATFEQLEKKNVEFISIKERFDTTSPLGKAMMYTSSVFAQLERDTIAERVKDNLLELAKSGRYLYAFTPTGYKKERKDYIDKNGKSKHYNVLIVDKEHSEIVKEIFKLYISYRSFGKIRRDFEERGFKTVRGYTYKQASFRPILSHPIYCVADINAYNYFKNLGCNMMDGIDKFTGEYGVHIFRRSKNSRPNYDRPQDWYIGAGTHEPLVESHIWIKSQEILKNRKQLSFNKPGSKIALLTGILKCGHCGSPMRPFSKEGDRFYYVCNEKEESRRKNCQMKNIRGDKLDKEFLESFNELVSDHYKRIKKNQKNIVQDKNLNTKKIKDIERKISRNKKEIEALVQKLALSKDDIAIEYIEEYINKLDKEIQGLQTERTLLKSAGVEIEQGELSLDLMKHSMENLKTVNDTDVRAKRNLIKNVIKDIVFDGENFTINFIDIENPN